MRNQKKNKKTMFCPKTKKGCFVDKISADIKLARLTHDDWWKGRLSGKKPIRSYKCEFCNYWHLTSKELN